MKKFLIHIISFILMTIFSSQTYALDFLYLKAQMGFAVESDESFDEVDIDTDIKSPYPLVLGLGVYISPLASLSLDIDYETSDLTSLPGLEDDEKIQFSATLNFYIHSPEFLYLEPFLGFGAGYAGITIEENDYKGDGFVWQLSGGFDINITSFFSLVTEARILEPLDISLESEDAEVADFDFSRTTLLLGLKLKL